MKKQKKVFGKKNNNIEQGSRRGIPMKTVTMIELGGAVVLVALLLLGYVLYTDGLMALKPKASTYQYAGAQKIEYTGDANFRNQEGIKVSDVGGVSEVANTPLISDEDESLTLTCDMLLMSPGEISGLVRINTFTKVTENHSNITYERNGKIAQVYGGFLHDGEDVYVFLEPVVLTIGNVKYDLGALSYAKVWYNQRVEFFNSTTREDQMIGVAGTDVFADFKSDLASYRLDLGRDLYIEDGQEALLFSIVEKVDPIEMRRK